MVKHYGLNEFRVHYYKICMRIHCSDFLPDRWHRGVFEVKLFLFLFFLAFFLFLFPFPVSSHFFSSSDPHCSRHIVEKTQFELNEFVEPRQDLNWAETKSTTIHEVSGIEFDTAPRNAPTPTIRGYYFKRIEWITFSTAVQLDEITTLPVLQIKRNCHEIIYLFRSYSCLA